jgi:SMC interacting uncharacterized protein involved in chromosome segregation
MIKAIDFGFLFSRVLAHYGFSDVKKVLSLPLVTFWMLSKNIDRMNAENDIRSAELILRTNSDKEGLTTYLEKLQEQIGHVVEIDMAKKAANAKRDVLSADDKAWINSVGDMSSVGSR